MDEMLKFHANGQWELVEKTERAAKQKRQAAQREGTMEHRPEAGGEAEAKVARESMSAPDKAPFSGAPASLGQRLKEQPKTPSKAEWQAQKVAAAKARMGKAEDNMDKADKPDEAPKGPKGGPTAAAIDKEKHQGGWHRGVARDISSGKLLEEMRGTDPHWRGQHIREKEQRWEEKQQLRPPKSADPFRTRAAAEEQSGKARAVEQALAGKKEEQPKKPTKIIRRRSPV